MRSILFSFLLIISFHLNAQFNVVGDASNNNGCYTLTPDLADQEGAIWNTTQIDLSDDFTLQATIDLGSISSIDADGIAFVLQQEGTSAIRTTFGGGYLAYEGNTDGIAPSLAVAFRTYLADNIEIWGDGDGLNNITGSTPPSLPDVSGPQPIEIVWRASTNRLTIDFGADGVDLLYIDDIVANRFGNNPMVYWGFTSATGGLSYEHMVCDIRMVDYIIPTLTEWGLILLGLVMAIVGLVAIRQRYLMYA